MVARVLVASAGYDHASAAQSAAIGRLERQGHFGPGIEGRWTAKFDAAFVNDQRFWTQRKA